MKIWIAALGGAALLGCGDADQTGSPKSAPETERVREIDQQYDLDNDGRMDLSISLSDNNGDGKMDMFSYTLFYGDYQRIHVQGLPEEGSDGYTIVHLLKGKGPLPDIVRSTQDWNSDGYFEIINRYDEKHNPIEMVECRKRE